MMEKQVCPSNFINENSTLNNSFDVETKKGQIKAHFTLGEVPARDRFSKTGLKIARECHRNR